MSKKEQKEFRKYVQEANKLTGENKKLLQAFITGLLVASKASA